MTSTSLAEFLALPDREQEAFWERVAFDVEYRRALEEAERLGERGPSRADLRRRNAPAPRYDLPVDDVVRAEKAQLLAIYPRTYVERLTGISAPPSGFIRCVLPDHDDTRRGNFKVYEETGWWCYACGVGGGIYQLGAALWGYSLPLRGESFKAVHGELCRLILRK